MNVLGRWVSSCRGFYQELNSANLTGAIDVLVVQQPDGRLQSTPFHVRFGKLGVLRPGDQMKVEVKVNGNVMPFYMTLDESGSAFFVEQEAGTPTPQGEARLLGGMVGGARSVSALDDEESTPTNSPGFESKGLPSVDDWSHGNTHVPIATRQSDPALLRDPSEEDTGSTLRSKSVPSITHAPIAQSSNSMLQDGGMEKDEDACLFELSDTEGSANNGGATDHAGVANMNESVGGRPTDEELETMPSVLSQSLPNSYLSDSDTYPHKLTRMIREDPSSVHSDTELEMGPSSRTTLSSLKLTGEPIGSSAPLPAPAKSDGFLRTMMMRLFSRGQGQSQSYTEEGLFLDDLETVFLPPEERSQYFPAPYNTSLDHTRSARGAASGDEGDSGVSEERSPTRRDVVSAPCSPSKGHSRPTDLFSHYGDDETDPDSLIANFEGLQLSLCGGLRDGASNISDETFAKHAVTFEQFANKPALLSHPDLVVKMKGCYYNWQVAAPLLMSILVFHKPLPQTEVDKLVSSHMRKEERPSWSWWRWGRRSSSIPAKMNESLQFRDKPSNPSPALHEHAMSMSSDEGEEPEERGAEQRRPYRHKSAKRKRRKSRYLTEEQLECLNLQLGVNEAEFSVTTMIQGTCTTVCSIYLWKSTDKIIVSDIDGTITRSDVAGHLLPMLGKDWSHAGVVALFNSVADNGYKFVYLSARPIGYAQLTRNYLQGVRQGNGYLPSGPMFLAPLSVLKAFTKEVIEKKPEEFKIACLEEIRKLFPPDRNPFYAGFGNKTTDETSYKAVGIPTKQMYTINTRGELKNNYLTSFKSSYQSLKEYIDHMFPPLDAADQIDGGGAGDDFSYLNFWRTPFSPETFQLPEDVV